MSEQGQHKSKENGQGRCARAVLAMQLAMCLCAAPRAMAQGQMPCKYEVAHIIQSPSLCFGDPPPMIGTAISPSGRYVCGREQCLGSNTLWLYDTRTRQLTYLPYPASNFNSANDVNEQFVVGSAGDNGFLYEIATGQTTTLLPGVPSDGTCVVTGINASNAVCGTRTVQLSPTRTSAFRWTLDSGFEDLGLIDGVSTGSSRILDNGMMLGWRGNSVFSPNTRVLHNHGGKTVVLGPIPEGLNSVPQDINDNGRILLFGQFVQFGVTSPFLYTENLMQLLPPLPGFDAASASVLDENDVALGRSRTLSNPITYRPTYWVNGIPNDLLSLYPSNVGLDDDGPVACSNAGNLLVNSNISQTCVILAPVPRPYADITGDCQENVSDLLLVITQWGEIDSPGDINGDRVVNVLDLLIVIQQWTE